MGEPLPPALIVNLLVTLISIGIIIESFKSKYVPFFTGMSDILGLILNFVQYELQDHWHFFLLHQNRGYLLDKETDFPSSTFLQAGFISSFPHPKYAPYFYF